MTKTISTAWLQDRQQCDRRQQTIERSLRHSVVTDINGLEFQEQIADGDHPPIIIITGHGDVSSPVRAMAGLQQRFSSLTPREREVLPPVASGLLNKQAAAELGISEVTLRIHRGRVMQKMEAASPADLVRIAGKLQIPVNHPRRAEIS